MTRDGSDDSDRKIIQPIDQIVGGLAAAKIDIDNRDVRKLLGEQPFGVRGAATGRRLPPKRPQQVL